MPMTDDELRAALAPLGEYEPTADELAAVVAAAGARTTHRRRRRLVAGLAVATGTAAILLTVLPASTPERRGAQATTPVDLLRTAAAVAAEQPEPPPFTGYRYTDTIEHWRWEPRDPKKGRVLEVEQRVEYWIDRRWKGRRVSHRGRVIDGYAPETYYFIKPSRGPFHYGDAPRAYPAKMPTEPAALREALVRSLHTEDWLPDPRNDEILEYHVVRRALRMLQIANTTPELRAALWELLARVPGVRPAPDARDPLGRPGEAVRIGAPVTAQVFTVMFNPDTAELLFWALDGPGVGDPIQSHVVVRAGHVAKAGDRP
jgi:hypothetical protein